MPAELLGLRQAWPIGGSGAGRMGEEGAGPQAQWRWRAVLSCLSRSTCLIPMNKLSTGNADTMSAVVKLAEKVDESASHVR